MPADRDHDREYERDRQQSPFGTKNRKRHNTSTACENCRQRKKKCDGVMPTCSTCLALKDECIWGNRDDWRKPLSRAETNALRSRVDELEALVSRYQAQLQNPENGMTSHSGSASGAGLGVRSSSLSMSRPSLDGGNNSDPRGSVSGAAGGSGRNVPFLHDDSPSLMTPPPQHREWGYSLMPSAIAAASKAMARADSGSTRATSSGVKPPTVGLPLRRGEPINAGGRSSVAAEHPSASGPGTGNSAVSGVSGNSGSLRSSSPRRMVLPRDEDLGGVMIEDDRGVMAFHNPTSAWYHQQKGTFGHPRKTPTDSNSPAVDLRPHQIPNHNETDSRSFARFLPEFYLTREQHDLAVDRFFRYYSPFAQRATPHLFYRDMEVAINTKDEADLPLVAPNYSPLLHNTIVNCGLAYAEEEHLRAYVTRRIFYDFSIKLIEKECASPCIATVQALAIRASFSSMMGDYSVGWINFGLATRLCYALALHIDTSALLESGKLSKEAYTQRIVTYWSCHDQELLWAIYIGREPLMSAEYTVPEPKVDPTTDETEWVWPPGPFSHLPPQPSYLSLSFVHVTKLMQIATDITHTIYRAKGRKGDLVLDGTVRRFSNALDRWLDQLPAALQIDLNGPPKPTLPYVIVHHMAHAWIMALLFQPFSQVSSGDFATVAMTRCHDAALRIDSLANMYQTQHGMRFVSPTMAQIMYTACTSFLLGAAQAKNPAQAADSLARARSSLEHLNEIGKTWIAGVQKSVILQDLIADFEQQLAFEPGGDGVAGMSMETAPQSDAEQPSEAEKGLFFPGDNNGDPMDTTWMGDASLDVFVQSLLSQYVIPLGGESDLAAVLHHPTTGATGNLPVGSNLVLSNGLNALLAPSGRSGIASGLASGMGSGPGSVTGGMSGNGGGGGGSGAGAGAGAGGSGGGNGHGGNGLGRWSAFSN